MVVADLLQPSSAGNLGGGSPAGRHTGQIIFLNFHQTFAAGGSQAEFPVRLIGRHSNFVVRRLAHGQAVAGNAAVEGQVIDRNGEIGPDTTTEKRVVHRRGAAAIEDPHNIVAGSKRVAHAALEHSAVGV